MTATERLRHLLDERGVEWWHMHDVENGYHEDRDTEFLVDGCKHVAHEWGRGLQVDMLTPEQAVEATLGRGTCEMEFTKAAQFGDLNDEDSIFDVGMFRCTACGTETYGMWNDNDECREWPRYCPNCGRRVAE